MRQRCRNPNNAAYKHYGARGILVCSEWDESFESFIADMGEPPSDKHSLDRINPYKGYEPGNCRWATSSEQIKNRRKSADLAIENLSVDDLIFLLSYRSGVKIETISNAIEKGKP